MDRRRATGAILDEYLADAGAWLRVEGIGEPAKLPVIKGAAAWRDTGHSRARLPPREAAHRSHPPREAARRPPSLNPPFAHAAFVVPLRMGTFRIRGEVRPQFQALLVHPQWLPNERWQLAGGKRGRRETGTFSDTGRRVLRGECGTSPRGFRVLGETLWTEAGGKKGHHVHISWGEYAEDAEDREKTLDWDGRPHETMWANIDDAGRARNSRGQFIPIRNEVKHFLQAFQVWRASHAAEISVRAAVNPAMKPAVRAAVTPAVTPAALPPAVFLPGL